jgi:hypothetical protein
MFPLNGSRGRAKAPPSDGAHALKIWQRLGEIGGLAASERGRAFDARRIVQGIEGGYNLSESVDGQYPPFPSALPLPPDQPSARPAVRRDSVV